MLRQVVLILIFFFMVAFACTVAAQVYKWVDENGNVHISDKPRPDGGDMNVIRHPSGSKASQVPAGASASSGEWNPSSQRLSRARAAAAEFLMEKEGWQETPDLKGYYNQLINDNFLTIQFHVPIPKSHFAGTSCTSGIQIVQVQTEIDKEDQSRTRTIGVELGDKVLYPNRCQ